MTFLIIAAGVVVVLWVGGRWILRAPDHSQYDTPAPVMTGQRNLPSAELGAIAMSLGAAALQTGDVQKMNSKERLQAMRKGMDAMGANVKLPFTVREVSADGVTAEWVQAPQADPGRRILYIHGGAFTMGSPRSHRPITAHLSRVARAAVLSIDYRLMPENPRSAGIADCQTAYRWILENGPDGPQPLDSLLVAGDSAGGNLTLMVIAWARDAGMRAANGAIALSPATDMTLGSPSLRSNAATDLMLGPMFGPLMKMPRTPLLWFMLFSYRMNPSNPLISPLFGDLSGLPPLLVQASGAEVLLDDAVRYVNKARAAGTRAELQIWPFMPHVWQIFVEGLPEAREAFQHIERFVHEHMDRPPADLQAAD